MYTHPATVSIHHNYIERKDNKCKYLFPHINKNEYLAIGTQQSGTPITIGIASDENKQYPIISFTGASTTMDDVASFQVTNKIKISYSHHSTVTISGITNILGKAIIVTSKSGFAYWNVNIVTTDPTTFETSTTSATNITINPNSATPKLPDDKKVHVNDIFFVSGSGGSAYYTVELYRPDIDFNNETTFYPNTTYNDLKTTLYDKIFSNGVLATSVVIYNNDGETCLTTINAHAYVTSGQKLYINEDIAKQQLSQYIVTLGGSDAGSKIIKTMHICNDTYAKGTTVENINTKLEKLYTNETVRQPFIIYDGRYTKFYKISNVVKDLDEEISSCYTGTTMNKTVAIVDKTYEFNQTINKTEFNTLISTLYNGSEVMQKTVIVEYYNYDSVIAYIAGTKVNNIENLLKDCYTDNVLLPQEYPSEHGDTKSEFIAYTERNKIENTDELLFANNIFMSKNLCTLFTHTKLPTTSGDESALVPDYRSFRKLVSSAFVGGVILSLEGYYNNNKFSGITPIGSNETYDYELYFNIHLVKYADNCLYLSCVIPYWTSFQFCSKLGYSNTTSETEIPDFKSSSATNHGLNDNNYTFLTSSTAASSDNNNLEYLAFPFIRSTFSSEIIITDFKMVTDSSSEEFDTSYVVSAYVSPHGIVVSVPARTFIQRTYRPYIIINGWINVECELYTFDMTETTPYTKPIISNSSELRNYLENFKVDGAGQTNIKLTIDNY